MKNNLIKIILLLVILFPCIRAKAVDFSLDGLNYNIISETDRTIELTRGSYKGDITVPKKLIINGKTYTVIRIGTKAFYECSGLTSVSVPNSVTSIGDYAFSGCNKLKELYCMHSTPIKCDYTFSDHQYINTTLYIPIGTLSLYEKVDPWRNFWNIEEYDFSGVDDICVDSDAIIQIKDDEIIITGIADTAFVEIFDISGKIVYNGYEHSIRNLKKGMYIIKINNLIKKIQL